MATAITLDSKQCAVLSLYHTGQSSMLYAASSTGGISTGSEAYRCGRSDTQWLLDLMNAFISEVDDAMECAARQGESEGESEGEGESESEVLCGIYDEAQIWISQHS